MSLDQNLFTLALTPSTQDPNVVDLTDPNGTVYYRKKRENGQGYTVGLYDPLSGAKLITVSAPNATSKVKILELCNPTKVIEMKYTGSLAFRWSFSWEEHQFEWKREECFMIRKPDPPVLVAITKTAAGKLKTSTVQILDYNLNRFDIDDRKGLEIVMLTALLTFQDSNEAQHSPQDPNASSTSVMSIPSLISRKSSAGTKAQLPSAPVPVVLEHPPQTTGLHRIVELQAQQGEYNEVLVSEEGLTKDYAQHCFNLLSDPGMMYITVRSVTQEDVPKVLQVVEETKRLRYKEGLEDEKTLHQYVLYDTEKSNPDSKRGPKRINLNDDPPPGKDKGKSVAAYKPPQKLTIHLSSIPMPELQPKYSLNSRQSVSPANLSGKGRSGREQEPSLPPAASSKKLEKDAKKKRQEEKEAKRGKKPTASSSNTNGNEHSHSPTPTPPSTGRNSSAPQSPLLTVNAESDLGFPSGLSPHARPASANPPYNSAASHTGQHYGFVGGFGPPGGYAGGDTGYGWGTGIPASHHGQNPGQVWQPHPNQWEVWQPPPEQWATHQRSDYVQPSLGPQAVAKKSSFNFLRRG